MTDKPKKPRGAAAWSPEFRKKMAIKGGRAGKPENRAFARDPDLSRRAGLKGGQIGAQREKDLAFERGRQAALAGEPKKARATDSWMSGYLSVSPLDRTDG